MKVSSWFAVLEWAMFLIAVLAFPKFEFFVFGGLTMLFFTAFQFQDMKEKKELGKK